MPKFRSKADVRGFQMRSPFHAVRAGVRGEKYVTTESEDTTDPIDEAAAYEEAMAASSGLNPDFEVTKYSDMPKRRRRRRFPNPFGRYSSALGQSFYTGPTTPGEMAAMSTAEQMQYGYA